MLSALMNCVTYDKVLFQSRDINFSSFFKLLLTICNLNRRDNGGN
jgi:hypothetical protein